MKKTTSHKTVLETLLDWSNDRPLWQRDALRRIVSKGRLSNTDIKELVELCKQGISGNYNTQIKPIPLTTTHLPANPDEIASVTLTSITDVADANNLASGQLLIFEQNGITIAFGNNATGKSGYVRILKRACRARHSGEIQPNIYAQNQTYKKASATIHYNSGGTPSSEKWQDSDNPHPILSAISVFDSDCAAVHLSEENEIAFRPFGLDVPDELAGACQSVKEILVAEQKQLVKDKNHLFLRPTWKEHTSVGQVLNSLQHDSDLQAIRDLGSLNEDEMTRLNRLREDLSKNPMKTAAEQKLKADNIKRLHDMMSTFEKITTDDSFSEICSLHSDAKLKRSAATIAAKKIFADEPLEGIGSDVWKLLWNSARRYSIEIAYPDQPFPPAQDDVVCVLCQQPLQENAIKRMALFDDFIKNDAEQQALKAEQKINVAIQALTNLRIDTRTIRASLQEVILQNPGLAKQTVRFVAYARLRKYKMIKALKNTESPDIRGHQTSPVADIKNLEITVRNYANELLKSAMDDSRKKLEKEFSELSDREILSNILPIVTEELTRLKNINFIERCLSETLTTAITKIGNDIADTIVTPILRDRFQSEIVKLAAEKIRVEIVRSGGKYGSPQYQIRLLAKPDAELKMILSEGEKTCVSLASFLAELSIATHSSALVFDDPVSSLDHRWRQQIAKRLVEESKKRQVIIFTHDLVFVNDLIDIADTEKQSVKPITISRETIGTGVVSQGLPWIAQSVEDRLDKIEKSLKDAKQAYDNNQEREYEDKTKKIYNDLRATWERALEDIVFFRVIQRHRDYINAKSLKKVSVLNANDCDVFQAGFKKCCDYVDAHDPSSGRNSEAPPPLAVGQDIKALKDWVLDIRNRQKAITV